MTPTAAGDPSATQTRKLKSHPKRLLDYARRAAKRSRKRRNSLLTDAIAVAKARSGEDYERDSVKEQRAMLRFLAYLRPFAHYFIVASLCGVTIYLVPNLIPTTIGYVIDHVLPISTSTNRTHPASTNNVLYRGISWYLEKFGGSNKSPSHQVDFLLGSLLGLLPIWAFLVFFRSFLAGTGGQRVIYKLRNDLYDHIQTLPLSYFQKHRSGSIVSRMTSDIAQAQNFIGNACTNLWMDSLSIIILGAILLSMDKRLALVSFAILPLWVLSVRWFGQNIRVKSLAVQEGLSELSGQVQEKVSGVAVVKAFARERREMIDFTRIHRALLNRQVDAVQSNALNMTVSNFLTTFAPITVIFFAAHEILDGRLSVGTMIMFWMMLQTFYGPLQRITDLAAVIANSSAAIERIFQIFDEKPDIVDKPNAIEFNRPAQGRIVLDHIDFTYSLDDGLILRDISLIIEPGEIVAFVGASGAGKSTLIQLLPRFYDVTAGRILIDGYDVRDLKIRSLRNQIGIVLQDNILFTGTIRDNILYGKPSATEPDIYRAAVAANADEFIRDLPNGYDTQIGERGAKLSGGQKQRIAITRAFLKNPPILILDEATSALDSESEKQIQGALNKLMIGRTTLIIAHRLSTILHADKIVVMQKGRIVDVGRHAELLERGGVYESLYKAQHQHLIASESVLLKT